MATKNLQYKKKRISVVDVHGQQHLFIEGEHIAAVRAKKSGLYISSHLPYQAFEHLHDLGKAVVDYRNMDKKKR